MSTVGVSRTVDHRVLGEWTDNKRKIHEKYRAENVTGFGQIRTHSDTIAEEVCPQVTIAEEQCPLGTKIWGLGPCFSHKYCTLDDLESRWFFLLRSPEDDVIRW